MIRINLLNSQHAVAHTRDRTGETVLGSERTVSTEARKSSRMVWILTVGLILLIVGGIMLYTKRYEVVAYLEQYTGPLNILPVQEVALSAEEIEEQRRDKIRQLYMTNTYRIQGRDLFFLSKMDSLRGEARKPGYPRIASLSLEGNDFVLDVYARSIKEFAELTKAVVTVYTVEAVKPYDPKPSKAMAGYRYYRPVEGTLRIPSSAETDTSLVETRYASLDKARKMVTDLAVKNRLKAEEQDEMKLTKGVVVNKYRVGLKLEGASSDFFKFLKQLGALSINVEQAKCGIVYAEQRDARKPRPDVMEFDYNVLVPVRVTEARADSAARP